MIKIKELNLPKSPNLAPKIDWGSDFLKMTEQNQVVYLKKLTSALNHSADLIQKERNQLLEDISVLKNQMENADKMVAIQKNIVVKTITDSNEEKQNLMTSVVKLQQQVKEQDSELKELREWQLQ